MTLAIGHSKANAQLKLGPRENIFMEYIIAYLARDIFLKRQRPACLLVAQSHKVLEVTDVLNS